MWQTYRGIYLGKANGEKFYLDKPRIRMEHITGHDVFHREIDDTLPVVSFTGTVLHRGTVVAGGQIQSELTSITKEFVDLDKLIEYWNAYHLNHTNAGCAHMSITKEVRDGPISGWPVCQGYRYGTAWLYSSVPEDVLETIRSWDKHMIEYKARG